MLEQMSLDGKIDRNALLNTRTELARHAAKLRAEGEEEEAEALDDMIRAIDEALAAHEDALAVEAILSQSAADRTADEALNKPIEMCAELVTQLEEKELREEAEKVGQVQSSLESGEASSNEISDMSDEVRSLSAQLKSEAHFQEADAANDVANALVEAVKASLGAEKTGKENEAVEALARAADELKSLAVSLREQDLEEDAAAVNSIAARAKKAAAVELSKEEKDELLCDCRVEVLKLREGGHHKEADALQQIQDEIEEALALQDEVTDAKQEMVIQELQASAKQHENEVSNECTKVVEVLHSKGLEEEATHLNATLVKAMEDGILDANEVEELGLEVRKDSHGLQEKGFKAEADQVIAVADKLDKLVLEKLAVESALMGKEVSEDLKEADMSSEALSE